MPRQTRRRILANPQRSQLLFLERPKLGERHEYGQHIRSAINARSFISEEPRFNLALSSWVSPQFTSFEDTEVSRGGRGKKKNRLATNTMNATSALYLHPVRAAGKYPALSFRSSASAPQRPRKTVCKKTISYAGKTQKAQHIRTIQDKADQVVSFTDLPVQTPPVMKRGLNTISSEAAAPSYRSSEIKKQTGFTLRNPRTPGSVPKPNTSADFTPPQIETPEMAHSETCHSSSILPLLFSSDQPLSPQRTERLLVKDTPETDYGLKVTWRRRKNIMKLLTERGLVDDLVIRN